MKRHIFLLAALALMTLGATAQSHDVEIGASLQYCHDFGNHKPNLGADLRITCQLNEVMRVRALANVTGFVANGFDRYGAALVGLSAESGMVYGFADLGISLNPSSERLANPAADLGLGLRHDIADRHHLLAETGIDFTTTRPDHWHGTLFLKIGYTFTLTKTTPQWPTIQD